MSYKCKIDGPFTREHACEFIEDIANTDTYIINTVQISKQGQLYNVFIMYNDGTEKSKTKRSVK